jgi:TatD DNase family protein
LLIDVDDALDRAAAVGVTRIVQVGCDIESSHWAVQTAREQPAIVATVALHPNEAPLLAERGTLEDALAEIDELAQDEAVRAVGETGLDYFRTGAGGREAQHHSFREHIRMAHRHDRTLVIHDRDAHDDVLRLLDDEGVPPRTVMHCFSGDADFARACVERGAFLSFAGTVTFKNAQSLRDALGVTPHDRILVETDAPFLTPTPYRGRPNASFMVPLTVRFMAGIVGISDEELCRQITANTDRAFGGPWAERI